MMISVILCTYNRADSLQVTLDTLMKQEGIVDGRMWELLIVDNNSKDNTRELVESFMIDAKLPIRYIFEPRQGKSYALNTGVATSRGEALAFTDDDVIVDKKWIASILEAISTYPHKAFGGKVVPVWSEPIPPWIQAKGPYSKPIVGGPIISHGISYGDEIKEYGKGMWVPIGANMFFRREVFDQYGEFRTDICPNGEINYWVNEDCDFCFRLKNNGEKLLYYPRAIIYHPVTQFKLHPEYLSKYFWDAGMKQAREDCRPGILRSFKSIVRTALLVAKRLSNYLFSYLKNEPAVTMHHKCYLHFFTGKLFYYIKATVMPSNRFMVL
jgi:glycosyltransferase involved in cell wall biosynthesis